MSEDNRKRILHIKYILSYDGATLVEYNFAKTLKDKYVFDWLVFEKEGNDRADIFEELGGKVYIFDHERRKNKILNRITELKDLRKFFREHPYDIVHIDTDTLRMDGVLYCAKKEGVKRRVIHSHNAKLEKIKKGLDQFAFVRNFRRRLIAKWATDYLACSKLAAEWMFPRKLVEDGKYLLVKNGIDGQRFLFDEDIRRDVRLELGLSDDQKLIGHIGRFSEQKNHAFLVNMFKIASDKDPNLRLLLIGNGELRDEIISKINEYGIADKVTHISSTDKAANYLFAMDVFILPSLYEGLPLTSLEAQASGLPTLMSDTITTEAKITSLAEYLPIDDPNVWADKLISTEKKDKNERINANIELKESGFEINDAAETLAKIYGE